MPFELLDISLLLKICDGLNKIEILAFKNVNKHLYIMVPALFFYETWGTLFLEWKPQDMTCLAWFKYLDRRKQRLPLLAAEINSFSFFEFLIEKRYWCINSTEADIAYTNKNFKILDFLIARKIFPDVRTITEHDDLKMLSYLKEKGLNLKDKSLSLTREAADIALKKDNEEILRWYESFGILPTLSAVSEKGRLDLLIKIIKTGEKLTQTGAEKAAYNNHLLLLKEYANYNVFPNNLRTVVQRKNFRILRWLIKKGVKPSDDILVFAEDKKIIKYLLDLGCIFDQNHIDNIAMNDNLDLIKFLYSQGYQVTYDFGFRLTVAKGALNVWKWLEEEKGMKPDRQTVEFAVSMANIQVLNILAERGIYPKNWGRAWNDWICKKPEKRKKIILWLLERNINPTEKDVSKFLVYFKSEEIILLKDFLTEKIANKALRKKIDINVLNILWDLNIKPTKIPTKLSLSFRFWLKDKGLIQQL